MYSTGQVSNDIVGYDNNNNAICIAQIRRKQQLGCSQCPKRKAFSLALNVSIDMSVDRKSFGRLFHTEGPWTVDRKAAVTVACLRAWNNQPMSACRSERAMSNVQ